MIYVMTLMAWLIAGLLSIILIYLSLELIVGLRRSKEVPDISVSIVPTGAILVPAHNEALSIAGTVSALRLSAPNCRIVVVADNCSDNTAELAKSAGAEAIIRNDLTSRGKGFALAFGRDYLTKSPPDGVLVIDADCRLSAGGADLLIASAIQKNRPVQAAYTLVAGASSSPLICISNFAMLVKNVVRARALETLGGGTLLFGTGMAFPWTLFAVLDLATDSAVEDLKLGLSLAKQGVRVSHEGRALVTSPAASVADSEGQRSRWEHGFLQTATRNALPLFYSGLRNRSRHLLVIGAHMMVPPLAMLLLLCLLAVPLLVMLSWVGSGSLAPVMLLCLCLALLSVALLAVWWREGRGVISGTALLKIPFYILWKVPIYLRYFTARQTGWNRTHRDGEQL